MLFIVASVTILVYVGYQNFADAKLQKPKHENGEMIWDNAIIDGVLTYKVEDGNDMLFKKMVDSALNEWEAALDEELVFEKVKGHKNADITFDEVKTLGKTKMYGTVQDVGGKTTLLGHRDMGVITHAVVKIVSSKNEVEEFTVVKHEIGHALGLFEHSDDNESVMYKDTTDYENQQVLPCEAELILEINYLAGNDKYGASLEKEYCYN